MSKQLKTKIILLLHKITKGENFILDRKKESD